MKILIVDDDADVREVLSRFLTGKGFETATEGAAEAALVRAAGEKYDAVMLDIELPGLSGMKAVQSFVETGARVYLMTGHYDSELETDALLLGAKALFPKPFDLEKVLAALRTTR